MNDKHTSSTDRQTRLRRALDEFQRQADAGQPPDVEEFLAEHADLADELRPRLESECPGRGEHGSPAGSSGGPTASCTTIPPQRNSREPEPQESDSGGRPAPDETSHPPDVTYYQPSSTDKTPPPRTGPPAANLEASGPVALPESFGRYRIKKCLGHGGMGSVYLAEDTQLDRSVALKVPKFRPDDGPEFLQRFHREAKSAAVLRHPNTCPVYDVGQIDGVHYLSMAYIEGEPLSERIRRSGPLPEEDVIRIVSRLASALEEAHSEGIIHRDLKPANIMIDDEPIIMDFGLARRVNKDDVQLTQGGGIMGSPAYMSPEQVEGDSEKMGPGCDVYSLGVIMYELLTGSVPFRGSVGAVMGQILSKPPPPPSTVRPDLDPRLEVVCLKMLSKSVDDRYRSMSEVIDALNELPESPTPPPRARLQPAAGPQSESSLTEEARAILSGRFPPWMIWTGVFGVIAAFGLTWMLLAMTLRMTNEREGFELTNEVQQAIAGEQATVFLDDQALTPDQLSGPIPMSAGNHNVEIRSGDTTIFTLRHTVPAGQTHYLQYGKNGFDLLTTADQSDRAAVDRSVAEYLLERGGRVQLLPTGQSRLTVEPGGVLPQGEFRITGVDMSNNPNFTNEEARLLSGLGGLEVLNLSRTAVTGDLLTELSSLTDLRELRLNGIEVKDAHLAALEPLHYLHRLSLRDTGVTEAAIRKLETALPACIIVR